MDLKYQYQGASAPLVTTGRKSVILDNEKRNNRLRIRVSAPVTVTVAAAGAVKNGGSLFGAFSLAITENGYDFMRLMPGWVYKQIAEYDAGQPLDFARLASGAAIGVYQLYEEFDIPFSKTRQAISRETCYMEANPRTTWAVTAIRQPNALESLVTPGAATVVLGDITVEVTQVYADGPGQPLPLFKPGFQPLELPINGASSNAPLEFLISERVSDIVFLAFAEDAAGGTLVTSAGQIINSLAFYGTGDGEMLMGPALIPFRSLVASQREIAGGNVGFGNGIFQYSLMPDGMLSDTIDPNRFANLRAFFNAQPLAAHTNSRIYVAVRTLERPEPQQGWPVVVPASALPAWAL